MKVHVDNMIMLISFEIKVDEFQGTFPSSQNTYLKLKIVLFELIICEGVIIHHRERM